MIDMMMASASRTPVTSNPSSRAASSESAKIPTGLTHSSQPTITIIAWTVAWKNLTTGSRFRSPRRPRASPKKTAKKTTWTRSSCTAASNGLVGTMSIRRSRTVVDDRVTSCSAAVGPSPARARGATPLHSMRVGATTKVVDAASR